MQNERKRVETIQSIPSKLKLAEMKSYVTQRSAPERIGNEVMKKKDAYNGFSFFKFDSE